MKFISVCCILFVCLGLANCYSEKEFLDLLEERGQYVTENANDMLERFATSANIFSKSISDGVKQLSTVSEQFANLRNSSINVNSSDIQPLITDMAQHILAQQNQIVKQFSYADQYSQNPHHYDVIPHRYTSAVRKTLTGAYDIIGRLVVLQKQDIGLILQQEVRASEELFKQLNLMKTDFEKVQEMIQQLLEHESIINSEMFRITLKFIEK